MMTSVGQVCLKVAGGDVWEVEVCSAGVASMILLLMMMMEDSDHDGLSSSQLVLRVLALLL